MLELLCIDNKISEQDLIHQISLEMQIDDQKQLKDWCFISLNNFRHKDLKSIFDPENSIQSYNECPLQYMMDNRLVFGFIDRLIVHENKVLIIDYKTHHHATKNNLSELSQAYQQQMQLYANGVKQLWPGKSIETYLLFTECTEMFSVDEGN